MAELNFNPDPQIDPILQKLEHGIPDYLTVEASCRLIQRIKQSVMLRAEYNAASAGKVKDFSPDSFKREDKVLASLLGSLKYSSAFQDFFKCNAETLGETMSRRYRSGALAKEWPKWDREKRLSLLGDISVQQQNLFNHSNLHFAPPPIQVKNMHDQICGEFAPGKMALSNRIKDKVISVSERLIDSPQPMKVMNTLWHENTHSLCQQFAAAINNDQVDPYNPFYADAALCRQRHQYDTYMIPFLLPFAYQADPEERLAFDGSDHFTDSWSNSSGLMKLLFLQCGL